MYYKYIVYYTYTISWIYDSKITNHKHPNKKLVIRQ
jgi:hypothetical protein